MKQIANEQEVKLSLTAQLEAIYGTADGLKYGGVLIPAVLGDFDKVLSRAEIGEALSEEYRVEDGRARILLSAVKEAGGSTVKGCAEAMGDKRAGQDAPGGSL